MSCAGCCTGNRLVGLPEHIEDWICDPAMGTAFHVVKVFTDSSHKDSLTHSMLLSRRNVAPNRRKFANKNSTAEKRPQRGAGQAGLNRSWPLAPTYTESSRFSVCSYRRWGAGLL